MRKQLWLIPVLLLLLAAYIVLESPMEDKVYSNPIGEHVDALDFVLKDGTSFRLHDADTITRLRSLHRWTNYHMYCCLEHDEVYAYVYMVADGLRLPTEPLRLYNTWRTPSFNLEFRLLLRQACDDLLGN